MGVLPSQVTYGTVTGCLVTAVADSSDSDTDPDQVACVGTVTFTPSPTDPLKIIASSPKLLVSPQPITAQLDSNGAFTVNLIATDDSNLNPSGWTYLVSFDLDGVKFSSFSIQVPGNTTTDLADAAPVSSSSGVAITRGPAGPPPTLTFPAPTEVPAGGTPTVTATETAPGEYSIEFGLVTGDAGSVTKVQSVAPDGAGNVDLSAVFPLLTGGKIDPSEGAVESSGIADATTVGKAVLTAADAAAARSAIGAGTSSLALGTTSTTALAGNTTATGIGGAANTKGGAEKVAAGSATTGTVTLDCSAASVFTISPTGNITLAPSNVPASGTACTITVLITMPATLYTVTMPAGAIWLGSAPTYVVSKKAAVTMLTTDGGTSWICTAGVQA